MVHIVLKFLKNRLNIIFLHPENTNTTIAIITEISICNNIFSNINNSIFKLKGKFWYTGIFCTDDDKAFSGNTLEMLTHLHINGKIENNVTKTIHTTTFDFRTPLFPFFVAFNNFQVSF